MEFIAILFVNLLGLYFVLGILSTFFLRIKVLQKIDSGLEGASFWLKLLTLPGRIAFWPALLQQWLKNSKRGDLK